MLPRLPMLRPPRWMGSELCSASLWEADAAYPQCGDEPNTSTITIPEFGSKKFQQHASPVAITFFPKKFQQQFANVSGVGT